MNTKRFKIAGLIALSLVLMVTIAACDTADTTEEVEDVTVVSLETVEGVEVDFGTSEDDVISNELPATVEATLSDDSTEDLDVAWSSDDYTADEADDYTFEGAVTYEGETTYTNEVTVTVLPEEDDLEEDPEENTVTGTLDRVYEGGEQLKIDGTKYDVAAMPSFNDYLDRMSAADHAILGSTIRVVVEDDEVIDVKFIQLENKDYTSRAINDLINTDTDDDRDDDTSYYGLTIKGPNAGTAAITSDVSAQSATGNSITASMDELTIDGVELNVYEINVPGDNITFENLEITSEDLNITGYKFEADQLTKITADVGGVTITGRDSSLVLDGDITGNVHLDALNASVTATNIVGNLNVDASDATVTVSESITGNLNVATTADAKGFTLKDATLLGNVEFGASKETYSWEDMVMKETYSWEDMVMNDVTFGPKVAYEYEAVSSQAAHDDHYVILYNTPTGNVAPVFNDVVFESSTNDYSLNNFYFDGVEFNDVTFEGNEEIDGGLVDLNNPVFEGDLTVDHNVYEDVIVDGKVKGDLEVTSDVDELTLDSVELQGDSVIDADVIFDSVDINPSDDVVISGSQKLTLNDVTVLDADNNVEINDSALNLVFKGTVTGHSSDVTKITAANDYTYTETPTVEHITFVESGSIGIATFNDNVFEGLTDVGVAEADFNRNTFDALTTISATADFDQNTFGAELEITAAATFDNDNTFQDETTVNAAAIFNADIFEDDVVINNVSAQFTDLVFDTGEIDGGRKVTLNNTATFDGMTIKGSNSFEIEPASGREVQFRGNIDWTELSNVFVVDITKGDTSYDWSNAVFDPGYPTLSEDDTEPTVSSVTDVTDDGPYAAGETVLIRVNFSEDILYDNFDGSNDITLEIANLGSGSATDAVYDSKGTDWIQFTYTVQDGDDADIATTATGLTLGTNETITDNTLDHAVLSGANSETLTGSTADAVAPEVADAITNETATVVSVTVTETNDLYVGQTQVNTAADHKADLTYDDSSLAGSITSIDFVADYSAGDTITITLPEASGESDNTATIDLSQIKDTAGNTLVNNTTAANTVLTMTSDESTWDASLNAPVQ